MAKIDAAFQKISSSRPRKETIRKINATIEAHGYEWAHSSAAWYRKSVTKRLRKQQQNRCCYCRRPINYNKGSYEIDHIVDKGSKNKKYSRFCFEFKNLALSCKDCNNNKGIKSVLTEDLDEVAPYPSRKCAFNWVHPHLHNYSEHISIHPCWIYEACEGNPEGVQLILDCKLFLLSEKELKNRRIHVSMAASLSESLLRVASFKTEAGLDALFREFGASLGKRWKCGDAQIVSAIQDLCDAG